MSRSSEADRAYEESQRGKQCDDPHTIDLRKLNAKEINAALEAGGYLDNAIVAARYERFLSNSKTPFLYEITFDMGGGERETGYVYVGICVDERMSGFGKVVAEF